MCSGNGCNACDDEGYVTGPKPRLNDDGGGFYKDDDDDEDDDDEDDEDDDDDDDGTEQDGEQAMRRGDANPMLQRPTQLAVTL